MRVNVKTVKSENYQVECSPTSKILDIKQDIQQQIGVEPEAQKLIYKGKHLDDQKTLEELGVNNDDCFVLMVLKVT